MTRKSINELVGQATLSFADNNSGSITPALLRNFCLDFLEAITPAYGVLSIPTGSLVQTFNIAPSKMIFNAAQDSDADQTTSAVPASTITRTERGTSTINFTCDFLASNGVFLIFELWKNGAPTPWRITDVGSGASNPVGVAMTAVDYADPAATYEILVSAENNGVAVTLSNAALIVSIDPVRSFT